MKSINMKNFAFVLAFAIAISSLTFAQTKQKTAAPKKAAKKMSCCSDMSTSDKESKSDSTGMSKQLVMNLEEIDKNKDGKVFIDGMCKDVVKDEAGECPKCGMALKEVSIKKAKSFLEKKGVVVK